MYITYFDVWTDHSGCKSTHVYYYTLILKNKTLSKLVQYIGSNRMICNKFYRFNFKEIELKCHFLLLQMMAEELIDSKWHC